MVSPFHLWQKSKLKYVQHNRGIIAIHALFFFSMNYSHADASDGKRATLGVHYWNSPYQARGIEVKLEDADLWPLQQRSPECGHHF